MAKHPRHRKASSVGSNYGSQNWPVSSNTMMKSACYPVANPKEYHPFGAQLANDIFDVYNYDEEEAVYSDDVYDYDNRHNPPLKEEWEGEQFELPLETIAEVEERYHHEIRKMKRAYNKMSHHALKWHYLMCDVEDNPQIKKMFDDMQMMRKLTGSDDV